MEIKTKFNIGQRVWVAEINRLNGLPVVEILSGIISSISINEDNKIEYFFNEWCAEYNEIDLIAYEDTETLLNKIIELDKQIIKEKENKQ